MNQTPTPPALQVQDLSVRYGRSAPTVDGVSFEILTGETVGLVGESGAGKSTIVKAILGLAAPTAGTVALHGQDITHLSARKRRGVVTELRAVFQDPYSSLSPFQTVGATVVEPLRSRRVRPGQARRLAGEAMAAVGLSEDDLGRYPHQFSGGQRQRIALARALVSDPQVVVMDEPVSALDLSTQAQVLNLLAELRDKNRYAVLFVAHDLGVVRFLCHRVVVLYRGMVMEAGTAADVTSRPRHPYTMALVAAAPVPYPARQAERRAARQNLTVRAATAGPGPRDLGCPFAARCPHATDLCRAQRPKVRQLDDRLVACHHPL